MSLVVAVVITTFGIVTKIPVFTTVLVCHHVSEALPPGEKQQHKHYVLVSTMLFLGSLYNLISLQHRDSIPNIQIYFVMNPNQRP